MTTNSQPRFYSCRSAGILILVGVLAGVTVGGGVGVIAASSTKTVTVCANKKTNMLRYAKNGKCVTKTETKVSLNQTVDVLGAPGAVGAKGDTGATGVKGDAGAAGTKGDTGVAGANGDTGVAGASGSGVSASAPTATVINCIATKCTYKIGETGPGGGTIFFVDYNGIYSDLDYLEAAPVGWGNGLSNFNLGGLSGELAGTATSDPMLKWCSNQSKLLGLNAWAKSAVATGAGNTSTADTSCTGGAIQAAADYAGGSKTDWFLPSVTEAYLMYINLLQVGVSRFDRGTYWTSTEFDITYAIWQAFANDASHTMDDKSSVNFVRPVRAF